MDYVKPGEVVQNMIQVGLAKAWLPVRDLLIRGMLSGALLGIATSLAITATSQTNTPLVGALVFPVGFTMIVLLGLELVTGSFALVPLPLIEGRISIKTLVSNLIWVFAGNLIGSILYGALLYVCLTSMGSVPLEGIAAKIASIAEAKTIGYAKLGTAGFVTAFTKGILCNWMVTLGVVMAMTSKSTIGKIAACWLPIFIFFAQGFEHSVVNMFIIPTGMMLGAKVTMADWWLWNQIPVTLGNFFGGFIFTGCALYLTYKPRSAESAVAQPMAAEPLLLGKEPT